MTAQFNAAKAKEDLLDAKDKCSTRFVTALESALAEIERLRELDRVNICPYHGEQIAALRAKMYELAMLSLQSDRYQADPEYRAATDNALALSRPEGPCKKLRQRARWRWIVGEKGEK
jgi:glyoxylase-like metal-dependent hydrolase (beta-lactamase superfamily II)